MSGGTHHAGGGSLGGRLLALILLFAPILAILGFALGPFWNVWNANGARLERLQTNAAELEAHRTENARVAAVAERWAGYATDPRAGFANSPSARDAAESALRRIRSIAGAQQGEWRSGALLDSAETNGVERIRIGAEMRLPEPAVTRFLAALEAEPPFLIIERFEARAVERRSSTPPALDVTIEAELYRLTEATP